MGVHDLWRLLSPSGHRFSVDTLANARLAVDVSIWLVHFIKAMRDREGNMLHNAHLSGMLRRICKLLYYGIRPVFVFDGPAPNLKRYTIAQRQKQREQYRSSLTRTAERLLLQQLKLSSMQALRKKLQQDKNKGKEADGEPTKKRKRPSLTRTESNASISTDAPSPMTPSSPSVVSDFPSLPRRSSSNSLSHPLHRSDTSGIPVIYVSDDEEVGAEESKSTVLAPPSECRPEGYIT